MSRVLRKLQTKAATFGSEQAPQWKQKGAELGAKADADKLGESVVTGTQVAAEKATKVYDTLVARDEKAFADETVTMTTSAAKAETVKTGTPAG